VFTAEEDGILYIGVRCYSFLDDEIVPIDDEYYYD